MPTTINAQNALQIREKPMEVYITLQTGSTAKITNYNKSGLIKAYDATIGNSAWPMRTLADLQDGGFLLDGSAVWYDSSVQPSEDNGKLGLRGDIGETITVDITAGATLTAVTVASSGVSTITKGGDTYTATGNDVITINASSATLVFTPTDSTTRVEINYITPGVMFNITNDTLISCTLALRGNLSVADHTWEESEIEVKMYYPNDISSSLAYIQNDWPITYQAGYDSDLSDVRKFYLSEPITQEAGVITIKGIDASHLLDKKNLPEQWLRVYPGNAHQTIYTKFINTIQSAGITLKRKQSWSGSSSGSVKYAIAPEMSARDFVSGVMNYTLNHKRSGTYYGIQFVDAGIPTVEHGDGTTYGNTWTIYKSDCGDWREVYDQNIATIKSSDSEHNFNAVYGINTSYAKEIEKKGEVKAWQIIEFSYDGYYYQPVLFWYRTDSSGKVIESGLASSAGYISSTISNTPSEYKVKVNATKNYMLYAVPVTQNTNGTSKFSNSNELAGITVELEPFVYGSILDGNGETVFNYPSLFKRSLRTGTFTWKGDPRMQPLDYITVSNDTGDGRGNITARISEIELTHEEGGTSAKITWREWN